MIMRPEHIAIAVQAIQIHAAMHPRPTQVTQTQAAEMLGISRDTVRRLVRANVLRLNRCGMIPVELVDAARKA